MRCSARSRMSGCPGDRHAEWQGGRRQNGADVATQARRCADVLGWSALSRRGGLSVGVEPRVGVAFDARAEAPGIAEAGLKWPTDVVWRGGKLAGILIEMQGDTLGRARRIGTVQRAAVGHGAWPHRSGGGRPGDGLRPAARPQRTAAMLLMTARGARGVCARRAAPFRDEWQAFMRTRNKISGR